MKNIPDCIYHQNLLNRGRQLKAHLINCTYCIFRQVVRDPKNKNHQQELCKLTYRPIPRPNQPRRYCDNFHQEGHDCESCWSY